MGDMVVLIEVFKVVGVKVLNVVGVSIDCFGYVLVLYLMFYNFNMIQIDLKGLLFIVEMDVISVQVVLYVGVVVLVKFKIQSGCMVIVWIWCVNGMLLLFGVEIVDVGGYLVGVMGQVSWVLLCGLNLVGELSVYWNECDGILMQCMFYYLFFDQGKQFVFIYDIIEVICFVVVVGCLL